MCRNACRHVYRLAYRHSYEHMYRYGYGCVSRPLCLVQSPWPQKERALSPGSQPAALQRDRLSRSQSLADLHLHMCVDVCVDMCVNRCSRTSHEAKVSLTCVRACIRKSAQPCAWICVWTYGETWGLSDHGRVPHLDGASSWTSSYSDKHFFVHVSTHMPTHMSAHTSLHGPCCESAHERHAHVCPHVQRPCCDHSPSAICRRVFLYACAD